GPAGLGRALALGAAHAGLIGLGWVLTTAAPGWWRPGIRLGVAVILTTTAARVSPWGRAALALLPILLLVEAAGHPRLRALGLARCRICHAALGLAAGARVRAHVAL